MSRPTFGDDGTVYSPNERSHTDEAFGAFPCQHFGTASNGLYPLGPDSLIPFIDMHSNDLGAGHIDSSMNMLSEEASHQGSTAYDGAQDQTCSLHNIAPVVGIIPADLSQATYPSIQPALPWENDEATIGRQSYEDVLRALTPSLPASVESYAPTQDMFPTHYTRIIACNAKSAVSDPSSVSIPQVDTGMDAIIGTIRLSGDIRCHDLGCKPTFGRLRELRRHYDEFHAVDKPEFWCSEPICGRSSIGGRPFHRVDKKRDHERKVHHRGICRKRR